MAKIPLIDVLRPYFFTGIDLGAGVQSVLELLHVDEYDTAWDDDGVVIWGNARIDSDNPNSPVFSPSAGGGAKVNDEKPTFDFHNLVVVRFRLSAARRAAGALTISGTSDLNTVLNSLGPTSGTAASDFPSTEFRLELLFELLTVNLPKLIGAKLSGWVLVPDPANPVVRLKLPQVLLRLTQDSAASTDFEASIDSYGAETMDAADSSVASGLAMEPPYALAPGNQFGFGFKKAVLDFSDKFTPPDLLDHFGVGDDWQGIYLPEVRFFYSSQKSAGVAFNAGVREMLIGIEPDFGLWGDLNFDVDFQGNQLQLAIRVYDVAGKFYDPQRLPSDEAVTAGVDHYRVTVPATGGPESENFVLFVDVNSGAAPFVMTAVAGESQPDPLLTFPNDAFFEDSSNHPEDISVAQRIRLFSEKQRVAVRVTSRNPQQHRVIVLDVYPNYQVEKGDKNEPVIPGPVLTPATARILVGDSPPDQAVLTLSPATGVLTVDGQVQSLNAGAVRVSIPEEGSKTVEASWTTATGETLERFRIPFEIREPAAGGSSTGALSAQGDVDAFIAQWQQIEAAHPGVQIRIDGYASREDDDGQTSSNTALSLRRADQVAKLLADRGIDASRISTKGWGNNSHPGTADAAVRDQVPGDHSATADWDKGKNSNYEPGKFRVAVASFLRPTSTTESYSGTLTRAKRQQVEKRDEPPVPQGQHAKWLRHVGGTVRFEHDMVPIAGELRMTVDFKTAHEEGLEKFRADIDNIGPGLEDPGEQARLPQGAPNPDDGVVEFRLTVAHDPSTGMFTETLVARAAESDRDGLWSWGSIPAANTPGEPPSNGWRDVLGLYFTLAPLLATTPSDAANDGQIVPLAIALGTPVLVTTLGVAHVLRITHYGVELDVKHDQDEVHAAVLLDVESALWLNIKFRDREIVTMRPDKPAKIRYKAVGFAFDAQPNQPTTFVPVFDSSRGYTIDLADSGSLRVLPGLLGDDIIKVLGARIARTNPLNIEVDLGFGVDLGVFTVDRFGLRLPIDPIGDPSITAIGVGVDITGVLEGHGYLEIKSDGFAGQLDLTLPSVGIRLAGGLAIRTVTQDTRSASAVMVTMVVELPTGIPLGGTGLSVFGLLGVFAMHHARLENASARTPALDWFANVVAGDPTDLRGWGPAIDRWAFGVGLVAGTVEGGTVLNVKGMLVLELPGPRVLLFVKANLLKKRPPTKGTTTGAIFATIDISPQRVLIGLQFEYHIEAVLDLVVPVEAGFFVDPPAFPPEHFYVDAGTIARPATAKILQLFEGTAYFMVHGDGIPDFPMGPLQGYSLATGLRASFTWGNTDIGLYLRVAAGFDVGVGFAPFYFAGQVYLDGTLRLFIVSIEAHGKLKFLSDGDDSRLEGRIRGKVDFFFFSVEGSVGFALGDMPGAPFPPPPIRDLMLQSRSPALVEGTATDRGVDTVLCRGTLDGQVPTVEVRNGDTVTQQQVFVPIDAIPLVQFEVAPRLASGATVDGQLSSGLPPGFGDGWQKRGPNFVKYEIRSIELQLVAIGGVPVAPGTSPVTAGPRPYTWRHPPQQIGSDGMPVELALLDWKPTNVDKAMLQGPGLDGMVDDRFGDVCTKVAAAAQVMWTFRHSPLGPSEAGWRLTGEAWPDAPGSRRSQPVDTKVRVYEIWRTGTFLDGLLPGIAATVVGAAAPCPRPPRRPIDPRLDVFDRERLLSLEMEPAPTPVTRDRSRLEAAISAGGTVIAPPMASRGEVRVEPATELARAAIAQRCVAKVLQAPYEVLAESVFNAPGFDSILANSLQTLDEQRKEALRDVIRIEGGPFVEMTLLVFARIKMVVTDHIKVRGFGPGNAEIAGVSAVFKQVSATSAEIPARWNDTSGPWWDDVRLARGYFAAMKDGGWGEFIVHIKLPKPALRVEIGVSPLAVAVQRFGMTPPSFFLAVIEGLSEREVLRVDEDNAEAGADQEGLDGALGDNKHALLLPNAEYRVVVSYKAEVGQIPVEPEEGQDPNEIVSLRTVDSDDSGVGPDIRTFFTDAEAPRNLDPWILAEFPAPGELYHFTDDPVVVVFATNDVLELFAAYQRQLRAVARAASFRGSTGTPEEPLTHLLLATRFEAIAGMVFSPWEGTVRRLLNGLTCGNFNPDSDHHGRVTLPFKLDPLTDYIVDLEPLTLGGGLARPPLLPNQMGHRPLHRQSFTTSRYRSRDEFAEAVRLSFVIPDRIANTAPLAALTEEVPDDAFDQALSEAGLEIRPRPEVPRVSVLWTSDAVAQPFAVLIETPEPAWRTRLEPEPEYDAETGIYIQRWLLERRTWLCVDELVRTTPQLVIDGGDYVRRGTGTKTVTAKTIVELRDVYLGIKHLPPLPPPVPASFVSSIVHDASGTRTVAILKPGARGKVVSFALTRNLHPLFDADTVDTPVLFCEVNLGPPPWEGEAP